MLPDLPSPVYASRSDRPARSGLVRQDLSFLGSPRVVGDVSVKYGFATEENVWHRRWRELRH